MRKSAVYTKFMYSKPQFNMNKKLFMHADRDSADSEINLSSNFKYSA